MPVILGKHTYRVSLRPEQITPTMLCSVYPEDITLSHWSHSTGYVVPAPKPGEEYGFIMIGPGSEKFDYGNDKFETNVCIPAKTLALDLIGLAPERTVYDEIDGHPKTLGATTKSDLSDRGLFVPEGDKPAPHELAAARDRLKAFFREKIRDGDGQFRRRGRTEDVEGTAKLAADYLKVKRPWLAEEGGAKDSMDCPACKSTIIQGAEICVHCHEQIAYDASGAYWLRSERKRVVAESVEAEPEEVPVAAGKRGRR